MIISQKDQNLNH